MFEKGSFECTFLLFVQMFFVVFPFKTYTPSGRLLQLLLQPPNWHLAYDGPSVSHKHKICSDSCTSLSCVWGVDLAQQRSINWCTKKPFGGPRNQTVLAEVGLSPRRSQPGRPSSKDSIIRRLGSAKTPRKRSHDGRKHDWKLRAWRCSPPGHKTEAPREMVQLGVRVRGQFPFPQIDLFLYHICGLKWPDSAWCICSLAHKRSENAELFLLMLICSVLEPRFTARSAFPDTIFPFVSVKVLPSHRI